MCFRRSLTHGHMTATLLDPSGKNRAYPMTDWLVDRWGTFWSTHWGAGVLKTDLRTLRSDQLLAGPAGNDIRALLFLDNEMWMAGANEAEFMGISVFEGYGTGWRYIEKRDNSADSLYKIRRYGVCRSAFGWPLPMGS